MDIGKIKSNAKSKHETFIRDFYSQIDKVKSDQNFRLESCSSKIKLIGDIFKEVGVIDDYGWSPMGDYRVFVFHKNSIGEGRIHVHTDGVSVVIDSDNYVVNGFSFSNKYSIGKKYTVGKDGFSWELFANDLVESIHSGIYKRSEAMEIKVSGIFEDPERNREKCN